MFPGIAGMRPALPTPIPTFSNVVLLTYGEGADGSTTFTDHSSYARALGPNGNVQVDTGIPIFGPSIQMDGSGDFVSTAHAAELSCGTNIDFCMEAFVRLDTLAKDHMVLNKRDGSGAEEFSFFIAATGVVWLATFGSGALRGQAFSPALMAIDTIYHVAGTRQGTTLRVFLNGALVGSGTQSGSVSTNTSSLKIGRDGFTTARDFQGRLSWVRYTKGEALYTADFTPPVPPMPTS